MSHPFRKTAVSLIGSTLLVATLGLAPAAAGGNDHANPHANVSDHDGDADSDSSRAYTEDDDEVDGAGGRVGNNVPDEHDNAHPSGRDRSVENGTSGNQGRSESEPDDDGHGPERDHDGTDKPNGPGGVDQADQDGNNGCGNDDDFEDDNEGWCGKPEAAEPAPKAATDAEAETETTPCPDGSMTRPCAEADADVEPAKSACPNGSMTRPCSSSTPANADDQAAAAAAADGTPAAGDDEQAGVNVGGSFGFACRNDAAELADDDAMPAFCVAAIGHDDKEIVGEVLSRSAELARGAAAETPASTVSARSNGALLASIPVLGAVLSGELPVTGLNVLTLLALAVGAVAVGTMFMRASRRKASTAS